MNITLQITQATHQDHIAGKFDSMAFIVDGEGREAKPAELMKHGFHVKPEDVDCIATLLARQIETVNVNMRRIYGKAKP